MNSYAHCCCASCPAPQVAQRHGLRRPTSDRRSDAMHVEHVDRALCMLRGAEALAQASRDDAPNLTCHLRPDDPFSHPLFGELVPTPALLLRVTRRRSRSVDAPRTATVEVVGELQQSYRFAGICDFQYASSCRLIDSLRALEHGESPGSLRPSSASSRSASRPLSSRRATRRPTASSSCQSRGSWPTRVSRR